MSAETLGWTDVWVQLVTLLMAAAALVIALLRVRVNAEAAKSEAIANDRKQELMMQGMFMQWSADMREELKQAQKEIRTLQGIVQNQQVIITRGRHEADRLVEKFSTEKELHKEREKQLLDSKQQLEMRIEALMMENGELRTQVTKLQEQVNTLNKRVEDVEKRARDNERALEVERATRRDVEAERDSLKIERDGLVRRVDELQNQVDAQKKLIESLELQITALRDHLSDKGAKEDENEQIPDGSDDVVGTGDDASGSDGTGDSERGADSGGDARE